MRPILPIHITNHVQCLCDNLGQFTLKDDKGWQKATLCDNLQCLIPFYNTLQYSHSLLQPFLTFSNTFRPFATFLDFTLFNTPPNCVTFSGTFHETLSTWLVHHSFSFSCIILGQSALRFTDLLHFILLLHLYLCFLLPLPPNRTESSPSTVLQCIDLRSCCASHCPHSHSHFLYIAPIAVAFFGPLLHYLYGPCTYLSDIFWPFLGPLSLYLHTHSPPFHCKRQVTLSLHYTVVFVVWLFRPYRHCSRITALQIIL